MKVLRFAPVLILALMLGSVLSLNSCGKLEASVAKVTVIDKTTGLPMAGVTVVLRPESTVTPAPPFKWDKVEAKTDAKGVATFDFSGDYENGQAGLFVLTIDVESNVNYYTSVGIIKVEEQMINEKTVEITP